MGSRLEHVHGHGKNVKNLSGRKGFQITPWAHCLASEVSGRTRNYTQLNLTLDCSSYEATLSVA